MHVTYRCPHCDGMNRSPAITPQTAVLSCAHCDWRRDVPTALDSARPPERCLACGNEDLWRQKDFPAILGVACVGAAAVLSGIAWAYYRPEIAYGILMAAGLLDMVLYMVMPDVMVCYRCQARHSGFDTTHAKDFNLELSERYRQEAIRLKQAGNGAA